MSAKQQEIAKAPRLAGQGEAQEAEPLGAEVLVVKQDEENLADSERLMEETVSRDNVRRAYQRVICSPKNGHSAYEVLPLQKETGADADVEFPLSWASVKEEGVSPSFVVKILDIIEDSTLCFFP